MVAFRGKSENEKCRGSEIQLSRQKCQPIRCLPALIVFDCSRTLKRRRLQVL